jgi:hypothetical protein
MQAAIPGLESELTLPGGTMNVQSPWPTSSM